MLRTGEFQQRSAELGAHLHARLHEMTGARLIEGSRGRGLWAGVDVPPHHGSGSAVARRLLERGVLVKGTHGTIIRLAPPVVIHRSDLDSGLDRSDLDSGLDRLTEVLTRSA